MDYKEYNNQIDSKIDWVGDVPQHWKKSKFKHEFSFSKSVNTSKNPTILSLTLQGIKIRDISTNEGQIASSYDNYTKVYKSDIVLNPMDLISGFVDCSPVEGVISPAYYTLKPNKDIDPEYYKYYLQKHYYERIFFPFAEGVSVDHRWTLKKEDFLNFSLIKPPIKEQKQIANYLSKQTAKIDATIEKNKELIELLEEKRIALINQVVAKGLNPNVSMKDSGIKWIGEIPKHWDVEKIKNISQVRPSNVDKKTKANEPQILLCNYTDVYNNEFITMDLDFMKATATHDQIRKLSLDVGDVIITKDSESADDIAVPAIVTEKLENVVCGYHLTVIRPNSTIINPKFLFRSFESDRINKQFELGSNGVTRFGLGSYPINNAYICKPPLNEQAEIVQYLDIETSRIAKATDKILKHTELLEEYKTSLIHHVVTGKIDVRGEVI
ncbi:restriction endonuclease subunit S [Methanobrevibacter smithii]|uniref:restriction endonuclease subunit S n=1 Tax=Methanobrevibacter smithii TaxID=2173 RepID=UPI0037DC74F9